MRVAVMAEGWQFVDHLAPVYRALEPHERAGFWTLEANQRHARERWGLHELPRGSGAPDLWLACGFRDADRLRGCALVYLAHGVGLQPPHAAASRATLLAAPNDFAAVTWHRLFPRVPIEVIGTPKMDRLSEIAYRPDGPVCVSLHWRGVHFDDAMELWRSAFNELEVIGHGHSLAYQLRPFFEELGIEYVERFGDVVRRASVYVCDNSSTMYEWAALGRPVVMLRSDARYTSTSMRSDYPVGPEAQPDGIAEALAEASDKKWVEARARATAALYPYLGHATERCLEVLRSVRVGGYSRAPALRGAIEVGA